MHGLFYYDRAVVLNWYQIYILYKTKGKFQISVCIDNID